jgi:uncharacterized protein with GYD domain
MHKSLYACLSIYDCIVIFHASDKANAYYNIIYVICTVTGNMIIKFHII